MIDAWATMGRNRQTGHEELSRLNLYRTASRDNDGLRGGEKTPKATSETKRGQDVPPIEVEEGSFSTGFSRQMVVLTFVSLVTVYFSNYGVQKEHSDMTRIYVRKKERVHYNQGCRAQHQVHRCRLAYALPYTSPHS